MNSIEVRNLTRRFGNLVAVNNVSFDVRVGEIFGFLGPNGAGKTTSINMLCTLLKPTSGTATISGYDIVRQQSDVRQSIGIIFQDPSLDERLTAWENLMFHGRLYDVPASELKPRAKELMEMMDLADKSKTLVRTFSGGMKRRLEIARGLLHRPRVLFLDEPTSGLDPQTRRHIWDYLLALQARHEITIFLTTHYMDEAEHAGRVAIIDHGQIVALDTPANLKRMVGGDVITLQTTDNARAAASLKEIRGLESRQSGDSLILETPQGDRLVPQIVETLSGNGAHIEIQSVRISVPTLEDVFIKLTGRAIRAQEASSNESIRMHGRFMGRR